MRYGYARVSTTGQQRNGNSLEDQEAKLQEAGCDCVIREAYTGTKMDRPKFKKLFAEMAEGDTLVVAKLDRFARTAKEGLDTVERLLARGVKVHILNMGLIEDTPTGKLILTILLAFAEFERNMIIERTSTGKEIARQKEGYREGRPRLDCEMFDAYNERVERGEMTVQQAATELGISRRSWYNLKKRIA